MILHLFEGFGVELEYMIINMETLEVLPVTDKILHTVAGEYVNDVEQGEMGWSNELALHVIELKTNGPAKSMEHLEEAFYAQVQEINHLLEPMNASLMPTAMHPWMDPYQELRLWPHDNSPIYEAYNRIFDCRGHGWANLQSTHINLPFADNEEFARLHAAIRLVLPLLPALAAASPIADGERKEFKDFRLEVYRNNQKIIPEVAGKVIPEQAWSEEEYRSNILQPMYEAIAPYDPEGTLQDEWLNSRGAIARFDRNTIEIRVIDIQECPKADLAIARFVTAVIKALTEERWSKLEEQKLMDTEMLANQFLNCVRLAEDAAIDDEDYLKCFGVTQHNNVTAKDLWRYLLHELGEEASDFRTPIEIILNEGTLATRILNSLPIGFSRVELKETYMQLAHCLRQNMMFRSQPAQSGHGH